MKNQLNRNLVCLEKNFQSVFGYRIRQINILPNLQMKAESNYAIVLSHIK